MTQQLTRRLYLKAFRTAGRIGACRPEDTVVLAGSPRSGTTLLLEVLQPLPGYETLNEPLLKKPLRDRHGFYHRTYIEPGQSAPQQHAFLSKVLSGRTLPPTPYWLFHSSSKSGWLVEHALHRRLLVKFCRINRMLHWFAGQFQVRGILLIVRHPCAAVSSMIRHPGWRSDVVRLKHRRDSPLYIGHLPRQVQEVFRPVIDRISTEAEALATMWCLDQYLPLFCYDHHPWLLVPYERLITRGREELQRMADGLNFEVTDEMLDRLHKPSSSVVSDVGDDSDSQLGKWRRQLSRQQSDEILRVVEETGLSSIYSYDPEPDYAALNRLQDPAYRWPVP